MQLSRLIKNRRGITLVEILVVMVILGIIGLIVVPHFEGTILSTGLKTSARELASELRYAQQQAVNEGVNHVVYVEPAKYSLQKAGAVLEEREMARDIKADVTQVVIFSSTGEPNAAKTIVLSDKTGSKLTVEISAIGRVSVKKQ